MDTVRTLGGPGKNAMNLLARRQRAAAVRARVLRRLDGFGLAFAGVRAFTRKREVRI
jgi:hypothetical protein